MPRRFLVGNVPTFGSGTASRPPSPVSGQNHWRTDKSFMETYDGAAWRVYGMAAVAANADISNPYTGQNILNTTDGRQYRYTGTAWVPAHGVIARGRRTSTSTLANPSSVLRLDNVPLLNGRMYRVYTNRVFLFGTANDTVSANIWYSTTGTATTGAGSQVLPGARAEKKLINGGGTANNTMVDTNYIPGADQTVSFLLIAERNTGSGNTQMYGDSTAFVTLTIEDVGPAPADTAVIL